MPVAWLLWLWYALLEESSQAAIVRKESDYVDEHSSSGPSVSWVAPRLAIGTSSLLDPCMQQRHLVS